MGGVVKSTKGVTKKSSNKLVPAKPTKKITSPSVKSSGPSSKISIQPIGTPTMVSDKTCKKDKKPLKKQLLDKMLEKK